MPFEIQHDWQASLSTPKPSIGERAKVTWLFILCFLWITIGLVGHQPWRPDEGVSINAIQHVKPYHFSSSWADITVTLPTTHSLYYWSASLTRQLFSSWLAPHDAARLATGLWVTLTLFMVGLSGRALWGAGAGRQTTLIFVSLPGLVFAAHQLTPHIAVLAGYAVAFYGLTLVVHKPWLAPPCTSLGILIAGLATGNMLPVYILTSCIILMPLLFRSWCGWVSLTSLVSILLLTGGGAALLLLQQYPVSMLIPQLLTTLPHLNQHSHGYFIQTLAWAAWPALPLALWSLYQFRRLLHHRPQFQLSITLFLVMFLWLGVAGESTTSGALPLLLPITMIASAAVDHLRRGAALALDWFSIMLFGFLGILIWLGWLAAAFGIPQRLSVRMLALSGGYILHIDWVALVTAVLLTLLWGFTVFKSKRSNRAAITDWAAGTTMCWGMVMTLWLPMIDHAKGYHTLFRQLQLRLPEHHVCITQTGMGKHQRAVFSYYLHEHPIPFGSKKAATCDFYLVQDIREQPAPTPESQWQLVWQGKRPRDNHERFHLYHDPAKSPVQ